MLNELLRNIMRKGNFLGETAKLRHKMHFSEFSTNKSHLNKTKYGGKFTVTMVAGDGFGSQLMTCVKDIFQYINVPVDFEEMHLDSTNESEDAINEVITSIKRNGAAIKGNIGLKCKDFNAQSRNVLLRKKLDLFANVLHCKSQPGIITRHNDIDVILIRQNTEGEYSCLEHEVFPGIVENLKIVTKKKSKEIARFAFQHALLKNRKKITTVHKANVMPLSDGLFLNVCNDIAKEYTTIEFDHMLLDTSCNKLVIDPWNFDVLLLTNLYGNVLSSIACGIIGPGIVSGQNYGHDCAVFEIGTRSSLVSDNPVPMINASIDLLNYLGLETYAKIIEDSVYKTLNIDGILTRDLGGTADASDVMCNIKKIIQNGTSNR